MFKSGAKTKNCVTTSVKELRNFFLIVGLLKLSHQVRP
jgi:hypothetical protein